ncbi:MAG: 4Fe-4S dicluster domain-containing protein [Bryobacteraceae bacterium]
MAALIDRLRNDGYDVQGPTVRDGAIAYEHIESAHELPAGWSDTQEPGSYRLVKRDDGALFQYGPAAQSWKRLLSPPVETILRVERTANGIRFVDEPRAVPRYAFVGVRSCDLHAMRSLETALAADPAVKQRREAAFIVVVNCGRSVSTCFCASMGTGPRASGGFDLALTELLEGGQRYLAESGSTRGAALLESLDSQRAREGDIAQAARAVDEAASQQQSRTLATEGLRDVLYAAEASPQWERVAARCTACGACTMVCPTCFCTNIADSSDVTGLTASRVKLWDSCFNLEFSYIHGGSVRRSGAARYRQWITHKLAYWTEQFDTHGCVGCGRCITWCPVGIDIVAEARAAAQGGSHESS